MKKQKPKTAQLLKNFCVRLSHNALRDAALHGVNIAEVCRQALDRELTRRKKVCMTCGHKTG